MPLKNIWKYFVSIFELRWAAKYSVGSIYIWCLKCIISYIVRILYLHVHVVYVCVKCLKASFYVLRLSTDRYIPTPHKILVISYF